MRVYDDMTYRDNVAALAARKAALDMQLRDLTRERDETARMLDQFRLPVLQNLRVAAPCNASWDAMTGDDRSRHCTDCNQQVFNLSALTTEQAESLIREKHGELCVRYYKRKDGTVLTADCGVGVAKRNRSNNILASTIAVTLFGSGAAASTRTFAAEPEEVHEVVGNFPDVSECDNYRYLMRELAACSPEAARETILDAVKQMDEALAALPPEARAQADNGCERALPSIRQSIQTACKPSEQRDENRGHDGDAKEAAQH